MNKNNNENNAKISKEFNAEKLLEKYMALNSESINLDFNNYIQREYEEINGENLIQDKQKFVQFQKLCERLRNPVSQNPVKEINFVYENSCSNNDSFKFYTSNFDNKNFFP